MYFERLISFKNTDESMSAFARRIGVSKGTLHLWEITRDQMEPKVSTVKKVAQKLGTTPEYLIFGQKTKD